MATKMTNCSAGLVLLLLAGCGPMIVSIGTLARESRENDIKAHEKYAGEVVQVSGKVIDRGLRDKVIEIGRRTGYGTAEFHRKKITRAFLAMTSEAGGADRLVCWLEHRKDAADILVGDLVTVSGEVVRMQEKRGGLLVTLNHCRVE